MNVKRVYFKARKRAKDQELAAQLREAVSALESYRALFPEIHRALVVPTGTDQDYQAAVSWLASLENADD
jgi:type II secretory pathway pseudopilin PulG